LTVNITVDLMETLGDLTKRAGAEIMKIYATDFDVETKSDSSPVTKADKTAEIMIVNSIKSDITDKFPIVSEEAFADGHRPNVAGAPFWLVDPLDGTKEFVNRNGEFTVNIALVEAGRPVLGVVHAPAIGATYWGSTYGAIFQNGDEAPQAIECRPHPEDGVVALVSRSHRTPEVDTFLEDYTVKAETSAGSSLKFCLVAAGQADIYPRLGRTMEWDTAAGHAVVRYAGGSVSLIDGGELGYGKPGFENPHFVVKGLA
jgi:3'(2'), 5'-bisphosphate nucleotidase